MKFLLFYYNFNKSKEIFQHFKFNREQISGISTEVNFVAPLVANEGPTEHVHMPILRKIQATALRELFNFGTENCVSDSICASAPCGTHGSSNGEKKNLIQNLVESTPSKLLRVLLMKPATQPGILTIRSKCTHQLGVELTTFCVKRNISQQTASFEPKVITMAELPMPQKKNIDALGYLKTQSSIELVVV
ncbi:hypothetical protein BDC45DRAFT_558276 [Circinella umbellata]|nr:hypothetical protein BDC45DRAFT_558276 [Circinella umbellata]